MSSRTRLAQLLIWQGWAVLSALVPSLAVSLLWAPGTSAWKLVTLGWVALWVLYLAVWLPLRFFRLGYRLEADRVLVTDGVLFPTVRIFPLAALQTASVSADPLQRLCGLRTLRLTAAGSELALPGLTASEAVRLAGLLLEGGGQP